MDNQKTIIEQIGGRKFIFAMFVLILGFALAIDGKIDFDQFMKLAVLALGIFSATNALQKIGNIKVNNFPTPRKELKEELKVE